MFFQRVVASMQTKLFSVPYLISGISVLAVIAVSCKNSNTSLQEDEKLEMDGTEKAIHQEFLMTRDPSLNIVPTERLLTALNFMKTFRTTQTNDLIWSERGPNNIGGRCRAILIDKNDATGNTVFAASVSGGLFKTTNFTSS